jgi:hypothetical protein
VAISTAYNHLDEFIGFSQLFERKEKEITKKSTSVKLSALIYQPDNHDLKQYISS